MNRSEDIVWFVKKLTMELLEKLIEEEREKHRKNYIHMSMCSSRGPQVMTSTQTSSQPTRRKSVYERFIKCVLWKFVLKISFQLKLNLLVYNTRACTRQLLEKIKQSFSLFFFFELQQENHNSSTNASHLIFFHFKCQSTISIYVLGKWKRSV